VDGGPDVSTDEYIGTSFSMANWGNWSTPNMTGPPEIYAYMNVPYASTADDFNIYFLESGVEILQATDYSWYGLGNLYNFMLLMNDFTAMELDPTNY